MATTSDPIIKTPVQATTDAQREKALPYVTNTWSIRVIQPILISGLIVSLFTAVLVFIKFVVPDEPLLRILPLIFFIVLEGIYTMYWLHKPNQRVLNRAGYRGAELLFIFLVTRAYTWIVFNNRPSFALFLEYLKSPALLLFGGYMVFTLIIVLICWGLGLGFGTLFKELAISEPEAVHFLTPKKQRIDNDISYQFDRSKLVAVFFGQWMWGGLIMILLTAMTTLDVNAAVRQLSLNVTRLGLDPALLWALVGYFIAGFLLLSQARLTAQSARWLRAGTVKHVEVERSWYRNSLWIVSLTALITGFIPIGSTTPIGRLLGNVLMFITAVISLLVSLFWALLARLSPTGGEADIATPPPEALPTPAPLPTPLPPPPASPPSEVAQYIFSSAIWAAFIVLTVIALGFFLRERGIKLNSTTLRSFFGTIWATLLGGWRRVSDQAAAMQHALSSRTRKEKVVEENGRSNPFKFIRVNGLVPREQIKYFYLSTLQRMEEKGIERGKGVTPAEFVNTLKEEFPDAEEDVELLTQAFLKARYSKKEIEADDINPVKQKWKQIRKNIRRRRG